MTRRQVVVLPGFFDRLDELLPGERTAAGGPSTADFVLHDLTALIDTLAEDFEGRTLPVDGSGMRILVAAGMIVKFVAVYSRERPDGTIEVVSLDIDESLS